MTKEQLETELAAVRAARNEHLATAHNLWITENVLTSLISVAKERPKRKSKV